MDALEIDVVETQSSEILPDIETIDREIQKATISSAAGNGDSVHTGLWGCGAFGGDAGVKLVVIWVASIMAGVGLTVMLGPGEHDIEREMERVVERWTGCSVVELRGFG